MTTRNLGKGAGAEQLGLVVDSGETVDVGGYRCIVSDPPWQEKGGSRGADKHYPLRQEHLLLGVRGRLHTQDHGVDSVIEEPRVRGADGRVRHSAKPEEAYRRIERVSPGPRLEMFARQPRDGWDVWGNEVETADRGAA